MERREGQRVSCNDVGSGTRRKIRIEGSSCVPTFPHINGTGSQGVLRRFIALGIDGSKTYFAVESLPKFIRGRHHANDLRALHGVSLSTLFEYLNLHRPVG